MIGVDLGRQESLLERHRDGFSLLMCTLMVAHSAVFRCASSPKWLVHQRSRDRRKYLAYGNQFKLFIRKPTDTPSC